MKIINDELSQKLFNEGFVHLKSLLNKCEINLVKNAIKSNLQHPSPFAVNISSKNKNGNFFMDFNNWRRLPLIKKLCHLPKLVNTATKLTKSKNCWLFHDHVLVKSGFAQSTPIHHDRPYHIFKGDLNCSIWITADDIEKKSSLIFYKSSHKLNKLFLPKAFINGKNFRGDLNVFNNLDNFNITKFSPVSFAMNSGDAVIFFNNILHSANSHKSNNRRRALSIRYLMDGASLTKNYINPTPPFDKMGVKITENGRVPEFFFPILKN